MFLRCIYYFGRLVLLLRCSIVEGRPGVTGAPSPSMQPSRWTSAEPSGVLAHARSPCITIVDSNLGKRVEMRCLWRYADFASRPASSDPPARVAYDGHRRPFHVGQCAHALLPRGHSQMFFIGCVVTIVLGLAVVGQVQV